MDFTKHANGFPLLFPFRYEVWMFISVMISQSFWSPSFFFSSFLIDWDILSPIFKVQYILPSNWFSLLSNFFLIDRVLHFQVFCLVIFQKLCCNWISHSYHEFVCPSCPFFLFPSSLPFPFISFFLGSGWAFALS